MGVNTSKDLSDKPVVLVVGGGYAGVAIARSLETRFNVVVIDRKGYFFHNIAALRPVAEPDYEKFICIPYDKVFKRASIIKGDVTTITPTHVRLHGHDEDLRFDYLVISTGTSYAFPAKVPFDRAADVQGLYRNLRGYLYSDQCHEILIVGGGPVGVELAGEIATNHHGYSKLLPNAEPTAIPQSAASSSTSTSPSGAAAPKHITLIHSAAGLVSSRPDLSPKLAQSLQDQLHRLGVNLVLGEKLDFSSIEADSSDAAENTLNCRCVVGHRTVRTSTGREIETDMIFFCNGARVNSSSYSEAFAHVCGEHGDLRVNAHLQVEGYSNIFAIGDCSDADRKMGYLAGLQAEVAAQNIIRLSKKQTLKSYARSAPVMLVPIGRNGGASQLPFFGVVGKTTTSMIKGNKLFVDRYWEMMGYSSPPKEFIHHHYTESIEEHDKRKNLAAALGCPKDQVVAILHHLPSRKLGPDAEHL